MMISTLLSWLLLGSFVAVIGYCLFTRNWSGLLILFGAALGIFAPFYMLNGLTIPGERFYSTIQGLFGSMLGVVTLATVGIWQMTKIRELRAISKPIPTPPASPSTDLSGS